ncbi:MAG: hypothetical protein ACFB3T_12750 [Geminicoccaceae bacterium]
MVSLTEQSKVRLFGAKIDEIAIKPGATPESGNSLKARLSQPGACFALIVGFAFEGHYYDLNKPALFLVEGDGKPLANTFEALGTFKPGHIADNDVRYWMCDKNDITVRLDTETGMIKDILLEPEIDADRLKMAFAGNKMKLKGPRGLD